MPPFNHAVVDAVVDAPTAPVHHTITTVQAPVHATKGARKRDLPLYFVDLDKAEARKCLLKLDRENPNRVTHLTSVLYSKVDPNNEDHYISLDTAILDFLRKIPTKFGMTQPSTKPMAYSMINDIVSVPQKAAIIEANVAKMKEVGKNADKTSVKIFMRLIGVLFSHVYASLYANLNDAKKASDFEKRKGRNNEDFYSMVSNEVNDDTNKMHHFLRECKDEMIKPEYDYYLNDEEMEKDEHPSGTLNASVNFQTVKIMIEQLTKVHVQLTRLHASGFHCDDPMMYINTGIKNAKMKGIIAPIAAYYFHMQCRFNQTIHSGIIASLPDHARISASSSSAASSKLITKSKKKDDTNTDNFETIAMSIRDFNSIYENTEGEKLMCEKQKVGLKDLNDEIVLLQSKITEKEKNAMQLYMLRFSIPDINGKAEVERDYNIKVREIEEMKAVEVLLCDTKKRYQSDFLESAKAKKSSKPVGIPDDITLLDNASEEAISEIVN
jgi:hypothetical protein